MKTTITLFVSFLLLLTANAGHWFIGFNTIGYHPGPSAAEMTASKDKVPEIKPVWNCHLCRGTGEMMRGTTCKCVTEQEKKRIKDQEKKIILDKSAKIKKNSKKSTSKSNFCFKSSEKSVTYCFYK